MGLRNQRIEIGSGTTITPSDPLEIVFLLPPEDKAIHNAYNFEPSLKGALLLTLLIKVTLL